MSFPLLESAAATREPVAMKDEFARAESFETPDDESSPASNSTENQENVVGVPKPSERLGTDVTVVKMTSPEEAQCSPSGVRLSLVLAGGALAIGAYYLKKIFSRPKDSKPDPIPIEKLFIESLVVDRPSVPLSPITPTLPNKKLAVSDR